jgi:N-acetylmuramoyl-L-alanine amidase
MRQVKKIILHCTATVEGQEFDITDVDRWHKKRGWKSVGYHYLIKQDGTLQVGRSLDEVGSHAKGENSDSIGIVYVGGLDANKEPKDTMTAYQELTLMELIFSLRTVFHWMPVHGHNEYSNKACPSFDVQEKYKFINEKI